MPAHSVTCISPPHPQPSSHSSETLVYCHQRYYYQSTYQPTHSVSCIIPPSHPEGGFTYIPQPKTPMCIVIKPFEHTETCVFKTHHDSVLKCSGSVAIISQGLSTGPVFIIHIETSWGYHSTLINGHVETRFGVARHPHMGLSPITHSTQLTPQTLATLATICDGLSRDAFGVL